MKVLCINDKNRPNEIPSNKWVKKDEEYHVTKVMRCNVQGGLLGYQLAEIDLSGCSPYEYFAAHRFRISTDPIDIVEYKEEIEYA